MYFVADALKMIREIRSKGGVIELWGALLNVPQFIGGLIFIGTIEGRLILATLIVTLVVAGQIHKRSPFSRLIGICHLPWCALLPWLVHRLTIVEYTMAIKSWLYYVVAVIFVSLILDAADLFRYVRGDRTYSWSA